MSWDHYGGWWAVFQNLLQIPFLTCFRTSFWFPSTLEDDGDAEVEDEP